MDETAPPTSFSPPPPPPLTPPPVLVPPSATPPRRRGRGWMIFALGLPVLLGISMLAHLGHLLTGFVPMRVAHVNAIGPRLEEAVLEDNSAASKIAVVEVNGII